MVVKTQEKEWKLVARVHVVVQAERKWRVVDFNHLVLSEMEVTKTCMGGLGARDYQALVTVVNTSSIDSLYCESDASTGLCRITCSPHSHELVEMIIPVSQSLDE